MADQKKMQLNLSGNPAGEALMRAIQASGGRPLDLASKLGMSKQRVDNWVYLMGRTSRNGAMAIDSLNLGVTKEELRPDVTNWKHQPARSHRHELAKTEKGMGVLMALARAGGSVSVLSKLAGLSSSQGVQDWIVRGYIPKKHLRNLLALPEFEGITGKMLRPDLHELDY